MKPKNKSLPKSYANINTSKKERSPKQNGITGRSSDEVRDYRLELGVRIIQHANYQITKKDFLEKYKNKVKQEEELQSIHNFKCPTTDTLRKDIDKIVNRIKTRKPKFEFQKIDKDIDGKELPPDIGDVVLESIKQVRLSLHGYSRIFFTSHKTDLTEKNSLGINTLKKIKRELSDSSIKTTKSSLVHLYIIFNRTGFEHFVSNFYRENIDYVLFTSTHEYCSEIIFEYQHSEHILNQTFRILKSYY